MDKQTKQRRCVSITLMACVLASVSVGPGVRAAGTKYQVKAGPGDIVLLRNVPARPAARSMPPSKALMINASPGQELTQGLGAVELSDAQYAHLSANRANSILGTGGPLTPGLIRDSVSSTTGFMQSSRGPSPAGSIGGAVGAATGGIRDTVSGALAGSSLLNTGAQR